MILMMQARRDNFGSEVGEGGGDVAGTDGLRALVAH